MHNTPITLMRADKADTAVARTRHDRLAGALGDANPSVRATACEHIANGTAPSPETGLRDRRANGPDGRVREQTA